MSQLKQCPFCNTHLIKHEQPEEDRQGWDKEFYLHEDNECLLKESLISPHQYEKWNTRAREEWQPIETAPKDGKSFYVQAHYKVPFKWKPYKPKSQQFKQGIRGRWQEMNDYGGWENSDKTPDEWQHNDG